MQPRLCGSSKSHSIGTHSCGIQVTSLFPSCGGEGVKDILSMHQRDGVFWLSIFSYKEDSEVKIWKRWLRPLCSFYVEKAIECSLYFLSTLRMWECNSKLLFMEKKLSLILIQLHFTLSAPFYLCFTVNFCHPLNIIPRDLTFNNLHLYFYHSCLVTQLFFYGKWSLLEVKENTIVTGGIILQQRMEQSNVKKFSYMSNRNHTCFLVIWKKGYNIVPKQSTLNLSHQSLKYQSWFAIY